MAFDEGDKAQCMEIARTIVKEVMAQHIAACPHGQLIRRSKAWLLGCSAGIGVSSGGLVLGIDHIIKGLF